MPAPGSTSRSPYLSGGQMVGTPPMTARIVRFVDSIYLFFGLYFVSLFSLDAYGAAESSQFNISRPENRSNARSRWGGGSPGGGSGGGGPDGGSGPGGGGGRKIGRVDDIRGPECKSCQ